MSAGLSGTGLAGGLLAELMLAGSIGLRHDGRVLPGRTLPAARPWSARGTVLAGLAAGCGLGFRLAQYTLLPGRCLDEAVGQLPPDLRELIAQTQATVSSAVLSHRA